MAAGNGVMMMRGLASIIAATLTLATVLFTGCGGKPALVGQEAPTEIGRTSAGRRAVADGCRGGYGDGNRRSDPYS